MGRDVLRTLLCTAALVAAGCGGGSPAPPTAPAPTPAPPAAPTRGSLSGSILQAGTDRPASGARVDIVEGINEGAAATADAEGRYRVENLEFGTFTVRVLAAGFDSESLAVTLTGDQTLNVALRPSAPPPPPPPTVAIAGTVVDGLSQQALPGALVRIDGLGETTTGADGGFAFEAGDPEQVRAVRVTSPTTVERATRLRVPGPAATVSLMPTSLDLAAFNQMFRATGDLHRWVTPPRLVIQRRALRFTDVNAASYTATANLLSDEEVTSLVADFEWALAQLTAGNITRFAGVDVETAEEDASVVVTRPGRILAARYEGLTAATNYWGYARWSGNGLGEVTTGIIKLDRTFELSASPYRRSLRAHELGHALGYQHVTARDSVMQSHARTEPTPFDRDAARIAFQRPPRNRAPDADPDPFVGNLRALAAQVFWAGSH